MLQRIRDQIGSAGLIVAIVALLAALSGGAYAATNSGGSEATASAKAKQGKQGKPGKPGKTGATGPQGPAGPQGLPGANGAKGDAGANGASGTNGANGKSVGLTPATALQCEERGGVILKDEGAPPVVSEICNGKVGPQGIAGNPWAVESTLPIDATETGTWAFSGGVQTIATEVEGVKQDVVVGDTEGMRVPISIPVKLSAPLPAAGVHYSTEPNFTDFDEGGSETIGCDGSTALPKAPKGNLCIYQGSAVGAEFLEMRTPGGGTKGSGMTGGFMKFAITEGAARGSGTWAVTGF